MASSGLAHPLLFSNILDMEEITINGMTINTNYVFYTWLGMLVLLIVGLIVRRNISEIPGRMQFFFESLVGGLEKSIVSNVGEKGRRFTPLLVSIFIYVLTMNLLGLIPGCDAPTANLNTTIAIALCVFIYYNYIGIRTWGFRYAGHFTGPIKAMMPMMIPIEIISHLARPLSMALRLFGNIFGEEMTLIIFFGFGSSLFVSVLLGTVPLYFLFLLGKVLQAFILFTLSMIYIQGALEHAH